MNSMNNRTLLSCISLFLCALTISAQNDEGTIFGLIRGSQGVLEGASAFLIKDMSTQEFMHHTISDQDGKFSITAPVGTYTLGVSFVGYTLHTLKVQITPGKTNLGSIMLEESTEELQTLVVLGRTVRVHIQPDGFVVNVKELRERANNALDLLKLIPKVQVKGNQLIVIGKEKVLVKMGNVLQRVDASEIASVLKGYDVGLIDRVEVMTRPPLRYDPDGNTAMIILHTSSIFREYMGGVLGTEEMWGSKRNYRFGGYGSLLYNHHGLFASIAPSINYNGSEDLEQQEYQTENHLYKVYTPSSGHHNYRGIRGNLQYERSNKDLIGLAVSWNKKRYDNQFESTETSSSLDATERIVENQNTYKSGDPRFTATAYWESTFGQRNNKTWLELSYFNLANHSQTDYSGRVAPLKTTLLEYTENNDINTSGLNLNNDYSFYLDADHKYLLETGVKSSWSFTKNYRVHNDSKRHGIAIRQKNNIRWDELIFTPYVSSTLRFNKQWWMRLGLRYAGTKSSLRQIDKNSTDIPEVSMYNGFWLPSLHASYSPSSQHHLKLTVNSEINRPKFKDLNPFVWQINEHSFYKGNTNLKPQQYYVASLGYTFMNALSIRGRVKRGLGIITALSTMQGDRVYTQVENAQNSLFMGVEAGYYFDKMSRMSASIDSYYGRSKYTSMNPNLLSEAKGNEWGVGGYLEFTFNKSRTWTGYLSGDYTGRKYTTVATIEPQYNLAAGMSCFLLDKRLSISLAGFNILSSSHKGVAPRNGYSISFNNRYDYPTLYFSISYKFSNVKDKSTSRSVKATQDIERRF